MGGFGGWAGVFCVLTPPIALGVDSLSILFNHRYFLSKTACFSGFWVVFHRKNAAWIPVRRVSGLGGAARGEHRPSRKAHGKPPAFFSFFLSFFWGGRSFFSLENCFFLVWGVLIFCSPFRPMFHQPGWVSGPALDISD